MNELMVVSICSMNYFFLKEVFSEINIMRDYSNSISADGYMVKGYNLYEAQICELDFFLEKLVKNWDENIEKIVLIEMREGGYLDGLSMEEIEKLLRESIAYICGAENNEILEKYLDVARKVKFSMENK